MSWAASYDRPRTTAGCWPAFVQVEYAPGNRSVEAFMKFQQVLPTLDKRYGLTYTLMSTFLYTVRLLGRASALEL
jgi:hypothetical protein